MTGNLNVYKGLVFHLWFRISVAQSQQEKPDRTKGKCDPWEKPYPALVRAVLIRSEIFASQRKCCNPVSFVSYLKIGRS